jgi:hypothetical protein
MRSLLLIALCFFGPIARTSRVSERAVAAILQQDGSVDEAITVGVTMNTRNKTNASEDAGGFYEIAEGILAQVDREVDSHLPSRLMEAAVEGALGGEDDPDKQNAIADKIAFWYYFLFQPMLRSIPRFRFASKEKAFIYACYFMQWFSETNKQAYSYRNDARRRMNQDIAIPAMTYLERKVTGLGKVLQSLAPADDNIISTYAAFKEYVEGHYEWNPDAVLSNGKSVADLVNEYNQKHQHHNLYAWQVNHGFETFKKNVMRSDPKKFMVH